MKYLAILFVFVFAALIVRAQTNNPTIYTYKQKQLNDSLKMLFPDLQTNKEIPYYNAMPVLPLQNEGIKVGSNNMGDVYSMQIDNMPLLKPFKNKG
jgi:hypothetical protein